MCTNVCSLVIEAAVIKLASDEGVRDRDAVSASFTEVVAVNILDVSSVAVAPPPWL